MHPRIRRGLVAVAVSGVTLAGLSACGDHDEDDGKVTVTIDTRPSTTHADPTDSGDYLPRPEDLPEDMGNDNPFETPTTPSN